MSFLQDPVIRGAVGSGARALGHAAIERMFSPPRPGVGGAGAGVVAGARAGCPFCAMNKHLPVALFEMYRGNRAAGDREVAETYEYLVAEELDAAYRAGDVDEVHVHAGGLAMLAEIAALAEPGLLSYTERTRRLTILMDRVADAAEARNAHGTSEGSASSE